MASASGYHRGTFAGPPMPEPIFILNGPNLNLLGTREPEIYGSTTLEEVRALCEREAGELGFEIEFRQSNHEGVLVDWVQEAGRRASALVLNPAAYGHTSVALLDALKALTIPVVECHLSNLAAREPFRRRTYTAAAVAGAISGFGPMSYALAIRAAADLVSRRS